MKYLTFNGYIAVPDDFDFKDVNNPVTKWVDTYLVEFEGLCNFDVEKGCNPEHSSGFNVMTEEQFEAQYDD